MQLSWPGFSDTDSLLIPLDNTAFALAGEPVRYTGLIYQPKKELHITVLGSTAGRSVRERTNRDAGQKAGLRELFESTDWSYTAAEYRCLARELHDRHSAVLQSSIIVMLHMPGMGHFHVGLKSLGLADAGHQTPPPHVTLYTHNCNAGISVHSSLELARLTRRFVTAPAALLQA